MKALLLACALCGMLAACAGQSAAPVGSTVPPPPSGLLQGKNLLDAQKTEGTMEHAFATAQQAYLAAAPTLAPDVKQKAKTALQGSFAGLQAARQALAAGQADGVQAQLAGVLQLAAQVRGLVAAH